jgi:hypothetical protein
MNGKFSLSSLSNITRCEDGFPSEYSSIGVPATAYTKKYINFAFISLLLTILEIAGIFLKA